MMYIRLYIMNINVQSRVSESRCFCGSRDQLHQVSKCL